MSLMVSSEAGGYYSIYENPAISCQFLFLFLHDETEENQKILVPGLLFSPVWIVITIMAEFKINNLRLTNRHVFFLILWPLCLIVKGGETWSSHQQGFITPYYSIIIIYYHRFIALGTSVAHIYCFWMAVMGEMFLVLIKKKTYFSMKT